MASFFPLSQIIFQYDKVELANHWLKAYEAGTTTPRSLYTDAAGSVAAAKIELDTEGFPISAGNARVTPYIGAGDFDLWLFPTEADADNNDTTSAIQLADDRNGKALQSDGPTNFETLTDIGAASGFIVGENYDTQGFDSIGDGGAASWKCTSITATSGVAGLSSGGVYRVSNGDGTFSEFSKVDDKKPAGAGISKPVSHIIGGIDSLTIGFNTGDDFGYGRVYSWFSEMIKFASEFYGYKGFYCSFVSTQSFRYGASISASGDFDVILNMSNADERRRHSFDFNGLSWDAWVAGNTLFYNPNQNWDTARVYFLRQNGGGSFEVDHQNIVNAGNARYTINTGKQSLGFGLGDSATDMVAGTYQLDYIEVEKMEGGNSPILMKHTTDGLMCLYGGLFTTDNDGVIFTYQANAGYKVSHYVHDLDTDSQEDWYSTLNPSHYILNGGTNDRNTSTPQEFSDDYDAFLLRLSNTTNPDMLLVSPNDLVDKGNIADFRAIILQKAIELGHGYQNDIEALGVFEEADNRGYMIDNTHPDYAGLKVLSQHRCKYFGIPTSKYATFPEFVAGGGASYPAAPYTGQITPLRTNIVTAGNSAIVLDLGLIHRSPYVYFDLTVICQRWGQTASRIKSLKFVVQNNNFNDTDTNKVTFVDSDVSEIFGTTTAFDCSITATIVNSRLQIEITASTFDQRFAVSGTWRGHSTINGNVVIENSGNLAAGIEYGVNTN